MKKIILILLAAAALQSCISYPDNPAITEKADTTAEMRQIKQIQIPQQLVSLCQTAPKDIEFVVKQTPEDNVQKETVEPDRTEQIIKTYNTTIVFLITLNLLLLLTAIISIIISCSK